MKPEYCAGRLAKPRVWQGHMFERAYFWRNVLLYLEHLEKWPFDHVQTYNPYRALCRIYGYARVWQALDKVFGRAK